jgi:hypothetical protein
MRLLYRSNFSRYLVDWIQFELNPQFCDGSAGITLDTDQYDDRTPSGV